MGKETEVRADAAERMNAVLTNTMAETEAEIASWAKKTADMEELMINMDNIADDTNYDVSKMVAAGKARPESKIQHQSQNLNQNLKRKRKRKRNPHQRLP